MKTPRIFAALFYMPRGTWFTACPQHPHLRPRNAWTSLNVEIRAARRA